MNSFQTNDSVGDSTKPLIDWYSPEIIKDKFNARDLLNNPFDIMEFKAANMDPFDLVLNQTPLGKDPPCTNFLSPVREPKIRKMRKSISLPDLDNASGIFVENFKEIIKDSLVKVQSEVYNISTNGKIVDQSNENDRNSVNISENKVKNNQECKIEPILKQDIKELDMEQISLCNEEEKKQIREQTRQRIEMLIKQEKQVYEEKCSRRSLSLCTPQRKSNASLDSDKSLFNKRLMGNSSNYNSDSSKYSVSDISIDSNDNEFPNASLMFSAQEQNVFDLNSLKPEWVVDDNFCDTDASFIDAQFNKSVAVDNDQIDIKFKTLNCIGTVEPKTNRSKTSMLTKRIPVKGPFLANVPLQQMMQNCDGINFNRQSLDKAKPVVSSPSTLDTFTSIKTPSAKSSRSSLSRKSILNTIKSPKTPLNKMKFIRKSSSNVLNDLHGNTSQQPNVFQLSNSTKSLTNVFKIAIEKKMEIQNSLQINKSKSETQVRKVPITVASNMKKITGLPVSKRSTMFKGKENVIHKRTNAL